MSTLCEQVRQAFPFEVVKYPLSGPDNMPTPHYGLFRDDNSECVGESFRKGYNPHTVDDICVLVEAAETAFDSDCDLKCMWYNHSHVVNLAPSKDYRRSVFGTTDNIFPRLWITGSYNGKPYVGGLGLYRDACKNMAMLQKAGESTTMRIRHSDSLRSNIKLLAERFKSLANKWDGVVETAKELDSKTVNLAEFLASVYPDRDSKAGRTRADKRNEIIIRRILNERDMLGRVAYPGTTSSNFLVSAWEAFNGVQGYTQHDSGRRNNPSYMERAYAALEDATVNKALSLALSA